MECDYCKKMFSTIYVLRHHQKTAKSCIKIQTEQGISPDTFFKCEHCEKSLTTKWSLTSHYKICKKIKKEQSDKTQKDYENELKKKDEEIIKLKEKLKTPPKAQKITNHITKNKIENNIGTNIEQQNITIYQIMSPEHVEDFFKKHYNLDTLLGGQKALARFVNDGFLKEAPVYLCGDRSRQKFYIVKDGKKTEDTDCDEILGLTAPGMPHVQDVYETALFDLPETVTEDNVQDNYQQIMTIDERRSDFKAELSKIAPMENTSFDKSNFKNVIRTLRERSERLGLTERQTQID
jgi:hypothetical protein